MRRVSAILMGVVLLLVTPWSRAGGVEIVTTGGTPWPSLVETIQDDAGSEGRIYHLVVRDGGTQVPCDEYQLSLDPVATAAFRVERCDAATSATALRLVARAALFEEGSVVPRALRATLTATISHHASVDGGGAPPPGGSKIWCSVALQPYLRDRLRGQTVPLTPDRFVLRPIESHIQAAPDGAGWIAKGESRFALRFHYVVVDVHTGSEVIENEASLVCADAPAGSIRASADPLPRPAASPAVSQPSEWVASLELFPPLLTLVGTVLVRPVGDIVFDDGTRAKALYGSQSVAVLGGSTLGFSYRRGPLFVPVRLTLAGDNRVLALSGFAGIGAALSTSEKTTLYSAAALRDTLLTHIPNPSNGRLVTTVYSGGVVPDTPPTQPGMHDAHFNQLDGALLLGIRHREWFERCHQGFDFFAEAAAPLASAGVWFVSAGIGQSWGPGGRPTLGGCPKTRK